MNGQDFSKNYAKKKTAEFNEKINFCQKKGGIILNINQKIYKKNKAFISKYNLESLKTERKARIIYNNKINESLKKMP